MTDLTKLKQLEEELRQEIEGNLKEGPLFGMLVSYFDKFGTYIAILKSDRTLIYLNKSARDRIKLCGTNPDDLINKPCMAIGGECELSENCSLKECVNTKKVVSKVNVKGFLSDKRYNLVCLPLIYNGVSAVIEMWTEVE